MPFKTFRNAYGRCISHIDKAVQYLLILLMAVMVINVLWQVATRFLLGDPSSYTEEIARFLLIWIGMLGGCYAYRVGAHLGLDLLSSYLEGTARKRLSWVISGAVIAFSGSVLIYGGGNLVHVTYILHQTSASLEIPMAFIYTVLPISGILLCCFSLDEILSDSSHLTNHEAI
ncbi:TRAP transporter small permease [Pseudomaricurvus sp.]|uniref:TRAP transporter small permease n=1 Tax=Pseudomaricurvus sp. TaxID=2004510 RepID=UPI003F6A664A